MSDKDLYLQATNELKSNNRDDALYAKAIVESDGDEQRAKIFYIKERVRELEQQTCSSKVANRETVFVVRSWHSLGRVTGLIVYVAISVFFAWLAVGYFNQIVLIEDNIFGGIVMSSGLLFFSWLAGQKAFKQFSQLGLVTNGQEAIVENRQERSWGWVSSLVGIILIIVCVSVVKLTLQVIARPPETMVAADGTTSQSCEKYRNNKYWACNIRIRMGSLMLDKESEIN